MVTKICQDNDGEHKLLDKLYYFHTGDNVDKLEDNIIKRKEKLMEKHYPSQFKVLVNLNLKESIENETLKKKTK